MGPGNPWQVQATTSMPKLERITLAGLAKLVVAVALLIGIGCATLVAWWIHRDIVTGLHGSAADGGELNYSVGETRIVRFSRKLGGAVVCSEGGRQTIYVASSAKDSDAAESARASQAAVARQRDAGWQICNAYANGAINQAQYAAMLARLVDGTAVSVDGQPRTTSKKKRGRRHGGRRR